MQKMTRRAALAAIPMLGTAATVPAIAAPAESSAADSYADFIRSLGDRVADGDRVQIFGSANRARVEIYRTTIERVHPKVMMPVEHIVASYRLTASGWESEGYHPAS